MAGPVGKMPLAFSVTDGQYGTAASADTPSCGVTSLSAVGGQ